ncbi:hypothetical protein [Haloechinothrix halophila]|uniref:hypothetical protein n=1 Tax=Haloechinothrix halophila TaxID=1069073 RepID=UPI000405155A|nr:hypothetical protein [Haloechinothrix halophila]
MQTTHAGSSAPTLPVRLGMGVIGGIVAGAGFIALTMWFAHTDGKDAVAPFKMISTIIEGPPPDEGMVWLGVVVHVVLSVAFGLLFALLTHPWGTGTVAALAGLVYGGVIYVVNFQILSRFVDHWSAFLEGTNQPFEAATHLLFGALLAVFFPAVTRRARQKEAPRHAESAA